jgi:hypothetical protein
MAGVARGLDSTRDCHARAIAVGRSWYGGLGPLNSTHAMLIDKLLMRRHRVGAAADRVANFSQFGLNLVGIEAVDHRVVASWNDVLAYQY